MSLQLYQEGVDGNILAFSFHGQFQAIQYSNAYGEGIGHCNIGM